MILSDEAAYWKKLRDYHIDDIDKCISVEANYAATKMMLTWIDILGAFYGGLRKYKGELWVLRGKNRNEEATKVIDIDGREYEKSGTRQQFLNFVKNCMHPFYSPEFFVGNKKFKSVEILYDHFRCGLIHEGHSKIGTGIEKVNSTVLFKFDSEKKLLLLNIMALRDIVRSSTFEYEREVKSTTSSFRLDRWRDRYAYLMAID